MTVKFEKTSRHGFVFSVALKQAVLEFKRAEAKLQRVRPIVEAYEQAVIERMQVVADPGDDLNKYYGRAGQPIKTRDDLYQVSNADIMRVSAEYDKEREIAFPGEFHVPGISPLYDAQAELLGCGRAIVQIIKDEGLATLALFDIVKAAKVGDGCNYSPALVMNFYSFLAELVFCNNYEILHALREA